MSEEQVDEVLRFAWATKRGAVSSVVEVSRWHGKAPAVRTSLVPAGLVAIISVIEKRRRQPNIFPGSTEVGNDLPSETDRLAPCCDGTSLWWRSLVHVS